MTDTDTSTTTDQEVAELRRAVLAIRVELDRRDDEMRLEGVLEWLLDCDRTFRYTLGAIVKSLYGDGREVRRRRHAGGQRPVERGHPLDPGLGPTAATLPFPISTGLKQSPRKRLRAYGPHRETV